MSFYPCRGGDQSEAYNAGRLQGHEDVKADPGAYNLTTHGSKTEFFQAAYDGGTITLRRTTGGIDDYMGSQYCGGGNGQVTGGYTFKW